MGRSSQESKSADSFWEMFLHQAGLGELSIPEELFALPKYLHIREEPRTVCSPPVTDTEVTHNWKMPDEREKKQNKRSTQQFKTFFGMSPAFLVLLYA